MKKSHILIVDDDHIARMGVALILKNLGYDTSEVFNGICALDTLKNEKKPKVDAIILDRKMPEMTGIQVLQKIQATPSLRAIPVIMLTAHANKGHVKQAMSCGAFDVIFKPIDEARFGKLLKNALGKKENF